VPSGDEAPVGAVAGALRCSMVAAMVLLGNFLYHIL
jgi:hypothetical protein